MARWFGRLNREVDPVMDVVAPNGSGRIRARAEGAPRRLGAAVFRIEDESGRVLRRVRGARHPQEALALFWRAVGAASPGATMSKDLERRIGRGRARLARGALQTEELPLGGAPAPGQAPAAQAVEAEHDAPMRRMRSRPAPLPQEDLFEAAAADDAAEHEPVDPEPPEPPPAQPPAAKSIAEPPASSEPEPRLLDPQDVLLQRVDPRNLRATDRADAYLYHVTNGPDAALALKQGLLVSTSDPMILTERQGVGYWLSVLAEDYDYILDGPADFVVLRLRRMTVEELLEPDPHASRSAGCPCYLLTGRG